MIVWRLQLNLRKWLSGYSLKTKITAASAFGHLCVLFSLFVVYRGNEQYHILVTGTMINTDVPIVFLPMHKSLMQTGGQKKSSSTASSVKAEQSITPAKKGTVAIALPEVKKKSKKTLRQASADAKAKAYKQGELKKKNKKETVKPVEEKKIEDPSRRIKDDAPQDERKSEPKKEIENPKPAHGEEDSKSPSRTIEGADDPNVLYVGQQEMDAFQMQDYIHQEMAQHWSPPAGMRKDISCVIKVIIGFDGVISSIEVQESSGVLIFDGAAKRAAAQLTPPQWAYGKEILLTFKP